MINSNLLSGATRWGLNAVLILCAAVALYLGQSIFIPTVIALLLAAMLWPAANWLNQGVTVRGVGFKRGFPWLERRGTVPLRISWGTSCVAMVLLLVALTLLVPITLGLAIPKMIQDFPSNPRDQQARYQDFRFKLDQVAPSKVVEENFPPKAEDSRVFRLVETALDPEKGIIISVLWQIARYGGSWIWQWILIMFILLFLLLEGRMLSRRVVEIFGPSHAVQGKVVAALNDMATQIRTYLVWRTIVNFGLALVLGTIYKLVGLSQPWTWGLVTAILCYIPYLGPIVAGIFPIIDAFISCDSPWWAVAILIFYVGIITLEGYLIVPVVMGRPMQLNATTVLLACLFWELVWGTPGLFLAMPLLAALKTICIHVPGWQPWANLMSTENHETKIETATEGEGDGLYDDTAVLTPAEAADLAEARQSLLEDK